MDATQITNSRGKVKVIILLNGTVLIITVLVKMFIKIMVGHEKMLIIFINKLFYQLKILPIYSQPCKMYAYIK